VFEKIDHEALAWPSNGQKRQNGYYMANTKVARNCCP